MNVLPPTAESADAGKARLERQKLALDVRLKRRELAAQHNKTWKEVLSNPVLLAIVGGLVTVAVSVATASYTSRQNRIAETERAAAAREGLEQTAKHNREAENQRAKTAQESAARSLQADLIKKAVETPGDAATKNLRFLAEVGLIPEYSDKIKKYLEDHPDEIPNFTPAVATTNWDETPPDQAFCLQRDFGVSAGRYLVRCFESEQVCKSVQQRERGRKTDCAYTTGLAVLPVWQSAGRGGIMNSWYRYSPTPFPKPFPQLS